MKKPIIVFVVFFALSVLAGDTLVVPGTIPVDAAMRYWVHCNTTHTNLAYNADRDGLWDQTYSTKERGKIVITAVGLKALPTFQELLACSQAAALWIAQCEQDGKSDPEQYAEREKFLLQLLFEQEQRLLALEKKPAYVAKQDYLADAIKKWLAAQTNNTPAKGQMMEAPDKVQEATPR